MRTTVVKPSVLRKSEPSPGLMPIYHKLKSITRTTIPEMKTLRPFSNSRLEGISECPIWGIVHMQRQYPQHGRALALEAGNAMHQFFAAFRCWQLDYIQGKPNHAMAAGIRIFGEDRWKDTWKKVRRTPPNDIDRVSTLAHEILHT